MKFSEILKSLRKENGLTQVELAKKLGLTRSSLSMYELGDREPDFETLEAMADFFNVDMDYLLGRTDKTTKLADSLPFPKKVMDKFGFKPVKTITLPLYKIACGEPKFMADLDLTIDVDADIDADYCLEAVGDSMINARIHSGDILFIKKCDMVDNGEIAVVAIGDEATLKRVYYHREENLLQLVPENPMHKPLVYSGAELDQVRILGKVVRVQFNL